MSAKRPGAGSRMEHDDLDRQDFPAPVAGESALLHRIRCHVDLRVMCGATKRGQCFTNVFAALLVTLRMQLVDVLSSFLRNSSEQEAQTEHSGIIEGISIMTDVCSHIQDLTVWQYNAEQMELVHSRFQTLTGWGRRLRTKRISADTLSLVWVGNSSGAAAPGPRSSSYRKNSRQQPGHSKEGFGRRTAQAEAGEQRVGDMVETPFLLAFLFALQSEAMPLLPLANTLANASRGSWNRERTEFTVAQGAYHGVAMGTEWFLETEEMPSFGMVQVFFKDARIKKFCFQEPWPLTRVHGGKGFLPEACRIPLMAKRPFAPDRKLLELSGKDSSHLSLALREWEKVMGTLAAELRIVLQGRFAISRAELPLAQVVYKNHPSWENNPIARAALWPVLAQYLILGQFEYVLEGDPLPIAILPIGAVPKSTFPWWRLILDCRYSNQFIDPWPNRYLSLAVLSLLLRKNCFFGVADIKAAYLLTRLGGCGRPPFKVKRFKTNECQNGYVEWEGEQMGCSPSSCGRLCDKSALGFAAEGHVMRAACTPFGMAVSHGTLAILTNAVQSYVIRRWGLGMGVFVDDLILIARVLLHGLCQGYLGGCPICVAAFPAAQQSQKAFDVLLDKLHLEQSEKRSAMAQQGVYLGIHADSHRGLYTLTEKKVAKLVRDLEEVLGIVVMTPRECSKVRGKLANYSFCMQRIKPFIRPFNEFIGGPKNSREWDTAKEVSAAMMDSGAFLLKHMGTLVRLGAPIWVTQASTLYDRFTRRALNGELQDRVTVLTHDAAEPGVGCLHCEEPGIVLRYAGKRFPDLTSVVTFADDVEVQVRREALGGWINFDLYRQKRDIGGRHIIIRNDCQSGLLGLQKGSRSPVIQYAAIQIAKACIEEGAIPYFLHVSGKRLIEEGVDDGSRTHAEALQGPACNKKLRGRVQSFARKIQKEITIDFFASSCNAMAERFMTWTDEPLSERTDAFSAASWDSSWCPHCEQYHREMGFFFTPSNLEDAVVRRARSDGAQGIFLVPNSAKQGYWQCLTREAITRVMNVACCFEFEHTGSKKLTEHSLFYVDFGDGSNQYAPPCGQALRRRPGLPRLRRGEAAELEQLHQQLALLESGDSQE